MTSPNRVEAISRSDRSRFHRLLSVFLCIAAGSAHAYPSEQGGRNERTFEVRGVLVPPDGVSFRTNRPFVRLGNPMGPPVTMSEVDDKGRFRIKRVPAGMYLLTAFVPRVARARRTVDVGPSLADAKGRIEVTVRMERVAINKGRYEVSVDQLSVPDQARQEYEKGRVAFGRGDLGGAAGYFRKAIDISPRFGAARSQLATIEYYRGNFRESAAHFREAATNLPGNYQVLVSLGAALLAVEDGQAALSVNSRVVEERPTDAQGQAQLGFSLFLLNRLDEAEVHLRRAVELDPANFFFPQLHLAEIYRRRNDLESVCRELAEFLRLHPDSQKAREIRPILADLQRRARTEGKNR